MQVGVCHRERESGFTLVELLVAMVISLVVMAAIYSTYHSQQKSYLVQEQVAAMQQNLRSAMYNMAREVRMAGYGRDGERQRKLHSIYHGYHGRRGGWC
jgi:type IV pilus assembly protein PilW